MTIFQMTPPPDGSRNSVLANGTMYTSSSNTPIPVRSGDVPILLANNWQAVPSSSPVGTAGSIGTRLRRLASAAVGNNPIERPPLIGSVPWTTGIVYPAMQVVSNGGNAYRTLAGGTAGATAPTGLGSVSDGTVTWVYVGPQTAPAVNFNAGQHANSSSFTLKNISADGTGSVRYRGGVPIVFTAGDSGEVAIRSVDMAPQLGNASGTLQMICGFLEWRCEGSYAEIGVGAYVNPTIQFIVDGYPLDYTFKPTGFKWANLDFSGISSTRHDHTIRMSAQYQTLGYYLVQSNTGANSYPNIQDNFSAAIVGDSQCGSQLVAIQDAPGHLAYPLQLMDLLGLPDMNLCAIGGTGFISNNGGVNSNYAGHSINDLRVLDAYRPLGLIIVQSSTNDIGYGAPTTTAAASFFQALRLNFPAVPIVVTGTVTGGAMTLANVQTTENYVFAAVSAQQSAGDNLIFWIPCATDPAGPWITGTGRQGATTGAGTADTNIWTDGIHMAPAGHTAWARRLADRMRMIFQAMP